MGGSSGCDGVGSSRQLRAFKLVRQLAWIGVHGSIDCPRPKKRF